MMRIINNAKNAVKKEVDEIKNAINNLTTVLINFTNVMNRHTNAIDEQKKTEEKIIVRLDALTSAQEQFKSIITDFFIQEKKLEIGREKDRVRKEVAEKPSPDDAIY